MKLIVITTETLFDKEAMAINRLFESGLELLHLRKPFASRSDTECLIRQIDSAYHPQIVLHDHYELTETFGLKGIHLNRRNSELPPFLSDRKQLTVSRSCHSLEEIVSQTLSVASHACDYVFLSPVFDSISKAGYRQGFTPEQLRMASEKRIIHERVMALGGIAKEQIHAVREYGFGGVAVLGALWSRYAEDGDTENLLNRFCELKKASDEE